MQLVSKYVGCSLSKAGRIVNKGKLAMMLKQRCCLRIGGPGDDKAAAVLLSSVFLVSLVNSQFTPELLQQC